MASEIFLSGLNDRITTRLPQNTSADALVVQDHHDETVDDGIAYSAVAYEKLNAGSALTLFITAPGSGVDAHAVFSIETDGPGLWTFSKLTDASGGTAITPQNHYLQSANSASTEATFNALVTSTGTILDRGVIGASGKFEQVGGALPEGNEFRLSNAEEVVLVFTADLASCRTVLRSAWHED